MTRPIPPALYSCAWCVEDGASVNSYPADEMYWIDAERGANQWTTWAAGWYCGDCLDVMRESLERRGLPPTPCVVLAEEIARMEAD